jgi:hypothetical protein
MYFAQSHLAHQNRPLALVALLSAVRWTAFTQSKCVVIAFGRVFSKVNTLNNLQKFTNVNKQQQKTCAKISRAPCERKIKSLLPYGPHLWRRVKKSFLFYSLVIVLAAQPRPCLRVVRPRVVVQNSECLQEVRTQINVLIEKIIFTATIS